MASHDLGDVGGVEFGVAGIFALRGIDDENRLAGDKALRDNARDDLLSSGSGIGGAFKRENAAGFEVGNDSIEGVSDVGEIRFQMLVKWRGNAQDDGIGLNDAGEVDGGVEISASERLRDMLLRDVLDVRAAGEKSGSPT